MEVLINVRGQVATCQDKITLTASSGVLTAVFDFDSEWDGMAKTALFTRNGVTESRLLRDDKCVVPDDVIKNGGLVVSVIGAVDGKIITTTNQCAVILYLSGYIPGVTIEKSKPDVFTDILNQMAEHNKKAANVQEQVEQAKAAEASAIEAAENAEEARKRSVEASHEAVQAADEANSAKEDARTSVAKAIELAAEAQESEDVASRAAAEAAESSSAATRKALIAAQAADEASAARDEAVASTNETQVLADAAAESARKAKESETKASSAASTANTLKQATQDYMESAIQARDEAEAARDAAEKARDEAQDIVGADYATKSELQDAVSGLATEEYVQQNGGKIQSVSVNGAMQSIDANKNVNITVPTKVSDLNNDAGFLTKVPSEYVTETELADKGYLTDLPSHTHSQYLTEVPSEYVTETELTGKGYLTSHQDISGKANVSDLNSHTGNTTVHITAAERSKWNAKPDKATTLAGYGITDGATKSEVSRLSEEIVDQYAKKTEIPTVPTSLQNPFALTIKLGDMTYTYDGSTPQTITIADGNMEAY